jgi:hypothetical protein
MKFMRNWGRPKKSHVNSLFFNWIVFSLYPSAKKRASSKNFVSAFGVYTLKIHGLLNEIIRVSYFLKLSLPPHFEFRAVSAISASCCHHFASSCSHIPGRSSSVIINIALHSGSPAFGSLRECSCYSSIDRDKLWGAVLTSTAVTFCPVRFTIAILVLTTTVGWRVPIACTVTWKEVKKTGANKETQEIEQCKMQRSGTYSVNENWFVKCICTRRSR